MGFPENVLTRDEKVVRKLHPHWRDVAAATLVGLLLIAAAIYVVRITPNDTTGNVIQWISVGLAVLIGIPLTILPFLRWRTTHYVITTHRVMVRRGIFTKTGKDITLSKITDVSFTQTLPDRILGSGTLNIESAGDSPDEMFHSIPHSDQVQQLINHLIDEDANRRAHRIVQRVSPDDVGETATAATQSEMPAERPTLAERGRAAMAETTTETTETTETVEKVETPEAVTGEPETRL